jgi:hypothetical protein
MSSSGLRHLRSATACSPARTHRRRVSYGARQSNHLGRWRRQRILHPTCGFESRPGSNSWWLNGKAPTSRRRLFPGQTVRRRCPFRARENSHLGRWRRQRILRLRSRRRGFDSRDGMQVPEALWSERRQRPSPLVPRPATFRQVRIEAHCHEQVESEERHPGRR